jgi:osmotically-inducible protein OsmY
MLIPLLLVTLDAVEQSPGSDSIGATHRRGGYSMSRRPISLFAGTLAIAAAFGLAACTTPQLVTGAAKAAFEDRKTETQILDTKITARILGRLADRDKMLVIDVTMDVWEGRVLVTGTLDAAKERQAVIALIGEDERIADVYDEIQIVTPAEKEERRELSEKAKAGAESVGQSVNDFWIETKINAQLVTTRGVTSVNYRWRCVRKNVFLIGRARGAEELDQVLKIIRATGGVESVTHYVDIKPADAS